MRLEPTELLEECEKFIECYVCPFQNYAVKKQSLQNEAW